MAEFDPTHERRLWLARHGFVVPAGQDLWWRGQMRFSEPMLASLPEAAWTYMQRVIEAEESHPDLRQIWEEY